MYRVKHQYTFVNTQVENEFTFNYEDYSEAIDYMDSVLKDHILLSVSGTLTLTFYLVYHDGTTRQLKNVRVSSVIN